MRRRLVLLAVGVMVLAHLAAWLAYVRNGRQVTGGPLTLTGRELRLPPALGDSTSLLLGLRWENDGVQAERYGGVRWLTVAKLEELGFDCRVSPAEAHARVHYRAAGLRPAFVVLEFRDEPGAATPPGGERRSRLRAVDVGSDPVRLREAHVGAGRFVIVRGLVRAFVETEDPVTREAFPQPRLLGRVVELQPGALSVPRPYAAQLQPLRREPAGVSARFTATVSWGADYLPRLEAVQVEP